MIVMLLDDIMSCFDEIWFGFGGEVFQVYVW